MGNSELAQNHLRFIFARLSQKSVHFPYEKNVIFLSVQAIVFSMQSEKQFLSAYFPNAHLPFLAKWRLCLAKPELLLTASWFLASTRVFLIIYSNFLISLSIFSLSYLFLYIYLSNIIFMFVKVIYMNTILKSQFHQSIQTKTNSTLALILSTLCSLCIHWQLFLALLAHFLYTYIFINNLLILLILDLDIMYFMLW